MYKFERLKVYQLSLDYIDKIYVLASRLPRNEEYNLGSQSRRAATSIALNIAEGSTGQTDHQAFTNSLYVFRSSVHRPSSIVYRLRFSTPPSRNPLVHKSTG